MNRMSKFMQRISFKNVKRAALLSGVATAGSVSALTAYADDPNASTVVGKVLGVITSIMRYVGIVLLVWGVAMLVLSLKNEDADSKTRAILLVVVSIVLIAFKNLLGAILDGFANIEIEELTGW